MQLQLLLLLALLGQGKTFIGVVVEVGDDTVQVANDAGRKLAVVVDGSTVIRRDGQKAKLADLEATDAVTVMYQGNDHADRIVATSKAKQAAAKERAKKWKAGDDDKAAKRPKVDKKQADLEKKFAVEETGGDLELYRLAKAVYNLKVMNKLQPEKGRKSVSTALDRERLKLAKDGRLLPIVVFGEEEVGQIGYAVYHRTTELDFIQGDIGIFVDRMPELKGERAMMLHIETGRFKFRTIYCTAGSGLQMGQGVRLKRPVEVVGVHHGAAGDSWVYRILDLPADVDDPPKAKKK